MKTTLFLPVRNEIDGVRAIMPRIDPKWVDEILVVDGNSSDGTREYFEERGIRVVRQVSHGVCGAYWECIAAAHGDIIIAFSPDNNSIPELIPTVVAKMKEGADMTVVSRYLDGARSEDDDLMTRFGNWMFTKMVNICFSAHFTDTLVMFRAFRKDLVERLHLDPNEHRPVLEMLLCIRCAKYGLKVVEIPGDEPKRIGGVRKMRIIYNGSCLLWTIISETLASRRKHVSRET